MLRFPEGHVRVSRRCVKELETVETLTDEALEKRFAVARHSPKKLVALCKELPSAQAAALLTRCLLNTDDEAMRALATDIVRERKADWIFELLAFGARDDESALSGARRMAADTLRWRVAHHRDGDFACGFRISRGSRHQAVVRFPEGELRFPFDRLEGLSPVPFLAPTPPGKEQAHDPFQNAPALPSPALLAQLVEGSSPAEANGLLLRAFLAGGELRAAAQPLLRVGERTWLLQLLAHWVVKPREAAFAADALRQAVREARWSPGLVTLADKRTKFHCEYFLENDQKTLNVRFGKLRLELEGDDYVEVASLEDPFTISPPPRLVDADSYRDWLGRGTESKNGRRMFSLLQSEDRLREIAALELQQKRAPQLLLLCLRRSEAIATVRAVAATLLAMNRPRRSELVETLLDISANSQRWRAQIAMRALSRHFQQQELVRIPRNWEKALESNHVRNALLHLIMGFDQVAHELVEKLAREESRSRLAKVLRLIAAAKRPFRAEPILKILSDRDSYTVRNAAADALRVSLDPEAISGLIDVLRTVSTRDSERARALCQRIRGALRGLTGTKIEGGPEAWEQWLSRHQVFLDTYLEDSETVADPSAPHVKRLAAVGRLKHLPSAAGLQALGEMLREDDLDHTLRSAGIAIIAQAGITRAWATRPLLPLLEVPGAAAEARRSLQQLYETDRANREAWAKLLERHSYCPPLRALEP